MKRHVIFLMVGVVSLAALSSKAGAVDPDAVLKAVSAKVSGERARDYTMRIWRYDRYSTLPMWKKSAAEALAMMRERGFDEAELVATPADGVTKFADWTNPIGWDVRQATLEVVEPSGLAEDVRFLSDYLANPSCLTFFACPTPPEGVEAEIAVLDRPDAKTLEGLNPKGKIILTSSGPGSLKRDLERLGALGVITDAPVGAWENENIWPNTWSDFPGGWLMTAADAHTTFCFAISAKKGRVLRDLLSRGTKVRVRALIDSRFYTDDTFPFVTGCIRGAENGMGEVLVGGHMFEWVANDNATGCAIMLESLGTLNDLIRSGALPRPKRTIRVWMGQELYGSLAFAGRNLERLRTTVAALCIDTPAPDYEALSSMVKVHMSPAVRPSFTDALYPELFRRYYASIRSNKIVLTAPFEGGTDTYFVQSGIGVPTTFVYMENGTGLHHNSRDTFDKVDARSLRDLSVMSALALYYTADAGFGDIPYMAGLAFDRGAGLIVQKKRDMENRLKEADTGEKLGAVLAEGTKSIGFTTKQQAQALASILRVAEPTRRAEAERTLAPYTRNIEDLGRLMTAQFETALRDRATSLSMRPVTPPKATNPRDSEAATLYPKATRIGTLTLEGIPPEEWRGLTGPPRWWSPRNWAGASYWWCDGSRSLSEIRELVELEAGASAAGFDFVGYYRFLEKHGLVDFVTPARK